MWSQTFVFAALFRTGAAVDVVYTKRFLPTNFSKYIKILNATYCK